MNIGQKTNKASLWFAIFFIGCISCKEAQTPTVETLEVTEITDTSATSGGKILSDGGALILSKGICWSLTAPATINDNLLTDITAENNFTSSLTELQPGTSYSVRAYATNSEGTGYGNPVYFRTLPAFPLALIDGVSSVTAYSAVLNGYLIKGKGIEIISVGIFYSTSEHPSLENSIVEGIIDSDNFTSKLVGLERYTKYYVRPYVIFRVVGTTKLYGIYGNEVSFTTKSEIIPKVAMGKITSWAETADVKGIIINDGGAKVTKTGFYLSTKSQPDSTDIIYSYATEADTFKIYLNNLIPDTHYFIRAFATNSEGTATTNVSEFRTCTGIIKDITGHTYRTQQIGEHLWFQENLQTTRYNDNTEIPLVNDNSEWATLSSPGYCWSAGKENNPYGFLYNWYAVNTGKLCPPGWHVPTYEELFNFLEYLKGLGGTTSLAYKIRDPQIGFDGVPAGSRTPSGTYHRVSEYGYWWSSTMGQDPYPDPLQLEVSFVDDVNIYIFYIDEKYGSSVRCIKD